MTASIMVEASSIWKNRNQTTDVETSWYFAWSSQAEVSSQRDTSLASLGEEG